MSSNRNIKHRKRLKNHRIKDEATLKKAKS